MRRPGYLGSLDNFWFGQYTPPDTKQQREEARLAERAFSRLVTSSGAATGASSPLVARPLLFSAHAYLARHPRLS